MEQRRWLVLRLTRKTIAQWDPKPTNKHRGKMTRQDITIITRLDLRRYIYIYNTTVNIYYLRYPLVNCNQSDWQMVPSVHANSVYRCHSVGVKKGENRSARISYYQAILQGAAYLEKNSHVFGRDDDKGVAVR
jgi:hypothetical protein